MEKSQNLLVCDCISLSVLSLQVASANAPIDKELEGKDAAQLAKQLWGAFFSADAQIPPRKHLSRRFAEPLSISHQIAYGAATFRFIQK